jgi:glutamate synthase (NADPH) large chain
VCDFDLPPAGQYAVGIGFLPQDPAADKAADAIEKIVDSEGLRSSAGATSRSTTR